MLKSAARMTLGLVGAHHLLRALRREAIPVLMYHGISAGDAEPDRSDRLSEVALDRQLAYLVRHYEVRPVEEWLYGRRLVGGSRPGAAVTFDDGLRSVLTRGLPILRKHNCPATLYLCPALIDQGTLPWFERLYLILRAAGPTAWEGRTAGAAYVALGERLKHAHPREIEALLQSLRARYGVRGPETDPDSELLTWNDAARLAESELVTFGAHSMTHAILSTLSLAEQEREIAGAREAIVARLGRCETFAYPNGTPADFTADTVALVKNAGYRGAVTTVPALARREDDPFRWPRLAVGPGMSMLHFAQRAAGVVG
jgi:peptidoglycan/xylan/chitin deacetylase (PgdA/CDA1 family)